MKKNQKKSPKIQKLNYIKKIKTLQNYTWSISVVKTQNISVI